MSINYRARRRNQLRKRRSVTKHSIKGKTILVMKRSYRTCRTHGTSYTYFVLDANGRLRKIPALKIKLPAYDGYNKKTIPDGGFLHLQRGNNSYYYHITSATPKKLTRVNWLKKQQQVRTRSRSRRRSRRRSRSRSRTRTRSQR